MIVYNYINDLLPQNMKEQWSLSKSIVPHAFTGSFVSYHVRYHIIMLNRLYNCVSKPFIYGRQRHRIKTFFFF